MPPTIIERRPDGELVVVAGRGGSGKTLYTMRRVQSAARLLVWDAHLQYSSCGCTPIATIAELARACSTRESAQLAYIGPNDLEHFHKFCRIALCWLKLAIITTVVEELADVSEPGKARGAWGEFIRWNRKLGGRLYTITQHPAETDKTILRNCQRIICHALEGEDDEKYMAKRLRVEPEVIAGLDIGKLEHLERRADGTTVRGFTPKNLGNSRAKSRRL
jgi:hypothetical protein